jgi:hypothetical protein
MKHSCKVMDNMIKEIIRDFNCKVIRKKKGSVLIYSHDGKTVNTFHIGERGIHPLRRYIKSIKHV